MSEGELQHLIQMANQIAANFGFHDDQVDRIADHLTRFWAPSMKDLFFDYVSRGGEGVDDAVREAVRSMTGPASP